jgi:hypothetical protein
MGDTELTVATKPSALAVRALSASQIVELWEAAQSLPPHRRSMRLLAAATPACSAEALAELTIGDRDVLLAALRRRIWGDHVEAVAVCPTCGEKMEMDLDLGELHPPPGEPSAAEPRQVRIGEYELTYRAVRCGDIDAAVSEAGGRDPGSVRRSLLRRCAQNVRLGDSHFPAASIDELPADVTDAIIRYLADADPAAETSLALACPSCGKRFDLAFDIGRFLWEEIRSFALRVLHEVHQLGWAYGWSERDVLGMSALRRQAYLSMLAT